MEGSAFHAVMVGGGGATHETGTDWLAVGLSGTQPALLVARQITPRTTGADSDRRVDGEAVHPT